jgi:tricorn protease
VEGGPWTQLTENLDRAVYHLSWSPDGKKILFGNKDFDLFTVEVATRKTEKIEGTRYLANDEFTWEISDYAWSPDSRWIAFSLPTANRNSVIYLYDTVEHKKIQLTNDFYHNLNPRWDTSGGYLYFISYRNYQIAFDPFEDNHIIADPAQIMVVQLQKGLKPPFALSSVQMPAGAASVEKETAPNPSANSESNFRIDLEGIQSRLYVLPVKAGNYFHLVAGKKVVGWSSVDQFTEAEYEEIYKPKGETKWSCHLFSIKDEKEVVLDEKIAKADLSLNGEQLLFQREGKFYRTTPEKAYESRKVGTAVELGGMAYEVRPREEWAQIFNDTWRWYRDFFYDREMHGRDWKKIGEKFRACLPDIQSREQLNWLLSEMVGELCVSHTYISGGDFSPSRSVPVVKNTGQLGVDLAVDRASGLYQMAKIYGPTPYFSQVEMPLARPDVPAREGNYLLAINGVPLKAGDNYFKLLQVAKDEYVTLTVNDKPTLEGSSSFQVKPVLSDRDARYARWVSDNIEKVLAASGGKVGYMHLTAMGGGGVMQFDKFWRAFRYKDGLIIDVRGNGGGWTEYFMIDKLERSQVAYDVLRGMEPYRYPNSSSHAHFVVISNEDNGSDGEAFVEHFKDQKLGTVVGVPSWGGLVGILNSQTTIDNGNVEQSNNAFFGRAGKWIVENHGADPDILQDNDPASVMGGKDLQLEKAVETALKKIKEQPWTFPARPAYPKK